MIILSIETSCDETAIAIIDWSKPRRLKGTGLRPKASGETNTVKILANLVSSQIEIHKPFGGVVPNLARREHEKNLVPILLEALKEAGMLNLEYQIKKVKQKNKSEAPNSPPEEDPPPADNSEFLISKQTQNSKSKIQNRKLEKILEREPILLERFKKDVLSLGIPNIDAIAVTNGPGLAPALWVGLNFAKALSFTWKKPLIPVNHMEGHIFSALLKKRGKDNSQFTIHNLQFPALALLVSGGHTELVLIKKLGKYKIIGETIDDAAGEAFDKVARILNLPYPGGPEISRLAELKTINYKLKTKLPRPMLHSKDFNFSFSGLKTAVLYLVRDLTKAKIKLTEEVKSAIAKEFQDAVVEVLLAKTIFAAKIYKAKTVILGGGVAANKLLRKKLKGAIRNNLSHVTCCMSHGSVTGDNALMIALAAAVTGKKKFREKITVISNLSL